jgi:uncharacterized protein YprB with RNaseH-like and TPR domain
VKVKNLTYPPFRCHCQVAVQLASNHSYNNPNVIVRVAFYIQHWGDIYAGARSATESSLLSLGVSPVLLATAGYEVDDVEYYALEPRGVRHEDGEPVQAFYLHDPKKRETLIKQRRLVPESAAQMVEMYGKPVAPVKADAEAVPA